MEKNKSLKVNNENIFRKLLHFIKKIFDKQASNKSYSKMNTPSDSEDNSKNTFLENIQVIHSDIGELLDLQKKYENNEITLYDLSQEQLYELNILYQRQIVKLKKQITDAQTEIKIVQYGLKNKNAHT